MSLIRVVDFETTGIEPTDEVCEVGWADYDTESTRVYSPNWRLCRVASIPPEARAVHHISAADTANELPWDADEFADRAAADGVVGWAAHKIDFERQWLADAGRYLICTYKVALRAWPLAPGHSNQCLRYWLADQGLINLTPELAMPPHRGGPDSYVTAHILKAAFAAGVLGKQMVAWTKNPALLPFCPIGEHRGKPWGDVPRSYLEWMAYKAAALDEDTRWNAKRALAHV